MSEELFNKIKAFTIKEACLTNEVLNRDTKLYDDLGISGDDAVEFLVAFGAHFGVDVSKFKVSDYFKAEGRSSFALDSPAKKKNLTLGQLEKAAVARKLDESLDE
jgi:hypothetical protein